MEGQSEEEDDEEMVGVPEDLKVGAADKLKRRGDHEEQSHRDDVTSDAGCRHKADGDGVLGSGHTQ